MLRLRRRRRRRRARTYCTSSWATSFALAASHQLELDLLVGDGRLARPRRGCTRCALVRQLAAHARAQAVELGSLRRQALFESPRFRAALLDLALQRRRLVTAGNEPPDREPGEMVFAARERQADIVVERLNLLCDAVERVAQPLLFLTHGLEPRGFLIELDLRLADVLLEEQRTLLECFDDAVRVSLEK